MKAKELLKKALSQTSEKKFGEIMDQFPKVLREEITSNPAAKARHEAIMARIGKGLGIKVK